MDFSKETKAFFLDGGNEGCLLIHGFTGSAAHMRPLGNYLHENGYTVNGILLKGHGTTVEDMEKCSYREWVESAFNGYNKLKQRCDKIYVMGLSMGGILSLYLAEKLPVEKVVSISAPIILKDPLAKWTPILKHIKKYNKWSVDKIKNKEKNNPAIGYSIIPIKSVPELLKLIKITKNRLVDITCPLLVVQPMLDKHVKPVSADIIFNKTSSTYKEKLWLQNSPHACTLGPEKELLHRRILQFIKKP
ncbi:alpha/beta fold hydrolase [Alkaliphilus pronyensis]|uniref:Alpha/beta fold hydrolase n=1 Tax=Alkaliphilus pronyensis TaxID=1482732 RepID=A0A6I0FKS2_9FIRM|nr:alpha/beta fold hydrolase [Alkaliphilus pronyensis]KAB3539687.1 alpha/beta fold hydrolase [Alkaliphilus pronyensis]